MSPEKGLTRVVVNVAGRLLLFYTCSLESRRPATAFQPVLHNWCNKGRGMCYPVCCVMHIKEVSHVAAAGFLSRYLNGPLPYVRRYIIVHKMC